MASRIRLRQTTTPKQNLRLTGTAHADFVAKITLNQNSAITLSRRTVASQTGKIISSCGLEELQQLENKNHVLQISCSLSTGD